MLTVETLAGEPLSEYSRRVANGWRLGKAGFDDGILVTLVMNSVGCVSSWAAGWSATSARRTPVRSSASS